MKKLLIIILMLPGVSHADTIITIYNNVPHTVVWEFTLNKQEKAFEEKTIGPQGKSTIKKPAIDNAECQLIMFFKDHFGYCVFNIPQEHFVTTHALEFHITDLGKPRLHITKSNNTTHELRSDSGALKSSIHVPFIKKMEEERAAEEKKRKNSESNISARGASTTDTDSENSSRYSADYSESR